MRFSFQGRRGSRVEGSSLSPPHTWSDSTAEQDEDSAESRHLFTVVVTLPEGNIVDSRVISDSVSAEVRFMSAELKI
ncbi:unnamed protein product [Cylicostephanus goldi]|uniref:Uncharacterized protein n=1 Tax=Cylicostephanus goldi TaxID=71465 RepID=A0A3P6T313_CYLGO|nr:unnamed protein product [Cylicostephanus goldi]